MGKNKRSDDSAEVEVIAPAEPMTTKLLNVTNGQQVFNLPHDSYCSTGVCACTAVVRLETEYNYRTEEHVARMVDRLVCSSISLLSGESSEFDIRVLNVPDIKSALVRGDLLKV